MTTKERKPRSGPTTWAPGKSGNPGGRSPRVGPNGETLAELARGKTKEAFDTLVALLDKAHDDDIRLRAANAILDRGWGKPTESVELDANIEGGGIPVIQIVRYPAGEGDDAKG